MIRSIFIVVIKLYRFLNLLISRIMGKIIFQLYLYFHGIRIQRPIINGFVFIHLGRNSKLQIGKGLKINSNHQSNPIGRSNKTSIYLEPNSHLIIGDNVGISNSSIYCQKYIRIGSNTIIGGNTVIYDTDFHSIKSTKRRNKLDDRANTISKGVEIGNDVFVGAHTTILKGVKIGNGSVIGSCSLVAKNIPENEIWGGNPIKFIKKLD